MTETANSASLDKLLIAQITGLIRATAEEAANKDPYLTVEYKAHFHKLIGADCAARGRLFDEAAEEFRARHRSKET